MTARGYFDVATGRRVLLNPVSITRRDLASHVLEIIAAVRDLADGPLSIDDRFEQSDYVAWTTHQYTDCCTLASTRSYHRIPAAGDGEVGTHYAQSDFGYDSLKRRVRTVTPGGRIDRVMLDARGNVIAQHVGTDDSGTANELQ